MISPFQQCILISLLLFSFFVDVSFSLSAAYSVDYNIYHNLTSFQREIELLLINHFKYAKPVKLSKPYITSLGNKIDVIELTYPDSFSENHENEIDTDAKMMVLLTFGEHARELVVLESFLDLTNFLISSLSLPCSSISHQLSAFLLSHFRLHLIPLLNPDGKHVLETRQNMCWRNNADGVDINRNSPWEYGGEGSSSDRANEEYRGAHPFSEIESMIIRDISDKYTYISYISVHSGERQLFVPFVDSTSKRMKRNRASTSMELGIASKVVDRSSGWFKNSGIGYDMNSYSADGTLFDYMAGIRNVTYAFCVELWGGDYPPDSPMNEDCFVQFNPKPSNLNADLRKMRSFYLNILLAIAEEQGYFIPYTWIDYVASLPKREERLYENKQKEVELSLTAKTSASLLLHSQLTQLCEIKETLQAAITKLET